jgi:hypothetical protein
MKRHSIVPAAAVTLAVALVLAACGGGNADDGEITGDTLGSGSATEASAGDGSAGADGTDAATGAASDSAELTGVAAFHQEFLTTYDEARLTGDTTALARIASDDIVAQAEAWHSKNEDSLADAAFIGAVDLTSTANIIEIKDRSGRTEIVDCTEEREDKEAAASGLPGYHYIDQSVVISGTEGSWRVDAIDVRATGKPVTGITCVPPVHEERIRDFLPRFDAELDQVVANPQNGLTAALREMTNEDLHPVLRRTLDVYVREGVGIDPSDVQYKYRVVGADTDVDQRIVQVERCGYLPDGEKFRSIETGELVDMSAFGAASGEQTWMRTYYVLFTDAFSDGFEYRLAGVGDEDPESDCWTSADFG